MLEEKLAANSPVIISIFCLLAVDRMKSIFDEFSKKYGKEINRFDRILKSAYDMVFNFDSDILGFLKAELGKLIPDTEDYRDVLADQAQCVPICLMYTLEYFS